MGISRPFNPLANRKKSLAISQFKLPSLVTILFLTVISLSGCVTMYDPEASQDYNTDTVGIIDGNSTVGQSFLSRRSMLNGITIWLTPSPGASETPGNTNTITVKLFNIPPDKAPVLSSTVKIPTSGNNIPVTIQVAGLKNPAGKSYYLQLSTNSGSIEINGRNEDAYPLGQAYINGASVSADMAFRLSYDYGFLTFINDLYHSLEGGWLLLPLIVLLWLPGWLLLEFTRLRQRFDLGEQAALSMGLSLALVPVLMLWTTILHLHWTRIGLLISAGFLVAVFIVRLLYIHFQSRKTLIPGDPQAGVIDFRITINQFSVHYGPLVILLVIFFLTLTVRLIMVRDLATPAWVDSVHHALITRLIMLSGSYPSSYLPYWDIPTTSYHPGFHAIAAAFTWMSALDLPRSILILGQVLNALTVFSVYLLAKTLTQKTSIGLFAAFIPSFLTPMPAYYTSWGRYTELAGLLILPVAITLLHAGINEELWKRKIGAIILGAIGVGGLFMVHYRVAGFLVLLFFAYLLFSILDKQKYARSKIPHILLLVLAMAVASILVVSPWLLQTIRSTIIPTVNTASLAPTSFFQDFSWGYLTSAYGKQALLLAGLGTIWGVIRRKFFTFIILLWTILLFLSANLSSLHLPGGGLINNTSVEIMLFIPISILGGYFLEQIISQWKTMLPKQLAVPALILIIFMAGWIAILGSRQLVTILNPVTLLSRAGDLPAIEWIKENIPEDKTIVINPFNWGYGLYAGNDGGFWISPLTGRKTLPPPVLYAIASNQEEINQHSQEVIDLSSDPSALYNFLNTRGLHYIYSGVKGGVISPGKLLESGLFIPLYHKDGAWIFSLKP